MKAIDVLRKVPRDTTIIIRVEMFGMRFESKRSAEDLIKDYNDELNKDMNALLDREIAAMYPCDLTLTLDLRQKEVV